MVGVCQLRVVVETHTGAFVGEKVHSKMRGKSMEVMAVFVLDDEGFVTRFEEFADTSFLGLKEERPIPSPQMPPDQVEVYAGPGDAQMNKRRITQLFDNIMLYEDLSSFFSDGADSGQMFSSNPGAQYEEVPRRSTGERNRWRARPVRTWPPVLI